MWKFHFYVGCCAGGRPDRYDVIGSVLCLVGVGLVSLRGSWQISWGDQLTILCSVLFAGHIVAASIFTKRHNAMLLTVLQFAFAAVWAWGCALGTKEVMAWPSVNQIASLLYLAVFSTSIGLSLQNYGGKTPAGPDSFDLAFAGIGVRCAVFRDVWYGEPDGLHDSRFRGHFCGRDCSSGKTRMGILA